MKITCRVVSGCEIGHALKLPLYCRGRARWLVAFTAVEPFATLVLVCTKHKRALAALAERKRGPKPKKPKRAAGGDS